MVNSVGFGGLFAMFSASRTGVLIYRNKPPAAQLTWFDRNGNMLGRVGEPYSQGNVALSPDGLRVAVDADANDIGGSSSELFTIDLTRPARSRLHPARGYNQRAVWSPNGLEIAFAWGPNGPEDLYRLPARGGEAELLLHTGENKRPQDWSRDGHSPLYTSESTATRSDLWTLPLDGTRKPIEILATPFTETHGQFSPDGRWVAYASDESGVMEVYVRPFPRSSAGGFWPISSGGGTQPRWSKDGKELFYITTAGQMMESRSAAMLSPSRPVSPECCSRPECQHTASPTM